MKKNFTFKFMLLLCALVVGSNAWADVSTWTISGVNTTAAGGTDVNTTLKTSSISPSTETGIWTAVASTSYAGSNSGAQLGSGSYTFAGTVTLSGSTIPSTATITRIDINLSSSGTAYKINATVGGSAFGSEVSVNQKDAKTYSFTGTGTGNNIQLTFSNGGKKNVIIKSISVTYTTGSSYTINAVSNNDSYGTVSLSGNVITATPEEGYTYADPAYTVTSGTATVAQSGNEFTVTPSSDCTVRINFEAIPTFTVTLGDDNSALEETSGGAGVDLPSRSDIGDYTFEGWSTTNVATETTTAPTIIAAGDYHPTANVTLHPIYTRTSGGGSQDKTVDVTVSDYATANSWGSSSSDGQKTIIMDSNVTATCSDGTNSGKYYSDGWRIYESENAVVTIETTSGELTSVTFTFTINNNGTLNYNNSSITSGTAVDVSGTSADFSVSRSSGSSYGQIRITAISVDYTIPGTTYYTSGYSMPISKWTSTTTSDGWHLIAAPVGTTTTASIGNLTSNTYDLFRFNQEAENEWEN